MPNPLGLGLALALLLLASPFAGAQSASYNCDYFFWSYCFNGNNPGNRDCDVNYYGYAHFVETFQNRGGDVYDQPFGVGTEQNYRRADCPHAERRVKCCACSAGYQHRSPQVNNVEGCVPCDTGKYQDEIAGGRALGNGEPDYDYRFCRNCPAGRYQDETGATSCKTCGGGRYQDEEGEGSCKFCPSGRANTNNGATSCDACPVGRYTAGLGYWYCLDCGSGLTTEGEGASSSSQCVDADECSPDWTGETCDHYCVNTPARSYTCSCDAGFEKVGDACLPNPATNYSIAYEAVPSNSTRCPSCYDAEMRLTLSFTLPAGAVNTSIDTDLLLTEFGAPDPDPDAPEEARGVEGVAYTRAVVPQTRIQARSRWTKDVVGTVATRNELSAWLGGNATHPYHDFGLAPCGCVAPAELTGSPVDLRIVQESAGSDIFFRIGWTDASLCEDSFFITRTIDGSEHAIGSYPSSNAGVSAGACGRFYDPDTPETRDSISDVSSDPPGSTRTYCVASTGIEYTSDPVCETVTIAWFGIIRVSVLTARGNGVVGVDLSWEIQGHAGANGTVERATRSDGSYDLEVQVDDLSTQQATVRLYVSKMTGNASHVFEYAGAEVTYIDVPLGHLDSVSISVLDTSAFVAEGRILMEDSLSLGVSCGSEGVEVCAVPLTAGVGGDTECAETDADGNYEVPIVIGGSFDIVPTLGNHTFESVADTNSAVVTIVNVAADVPLVDFTDVTTSQATVTVAGGLCHRDLGRVLLEFRSQSNCLVHTVWQESPTVNYTLPAMDMTIAVEQVDAVTGVSGDDARAYLERVNLQRQQANFKELTAAVREFIYHPQPVISLDTHASFLGSCTDYRVIKSWYGYDFTVEVQQDFGDSGLCHDVSGNVTLQDNLMETAECASGCELVLEQETAEILGQGTVVQRSAVTKRLIAGPPNVFPPHTRSVRATFAYGGQDAVTAEEEFFIEGDKLLGDSFSVDFPQGLPLMVLHDPPGGGSFSTYTDVSRSSTSISVTSTNSEEASARTRIHAGVDVQSTTCVGAIAAYQCLEILEVESSVYGELEVSGERAEEDKYGFDFTVQSAQNYQTAGTADDDVDSRESTMILSMSLNLKFSRVDRVAYNESTCSAVLSTALAWQPESPDSGEAVFWRSVYDVENVIIPDLELGLEADNEGGVNATRIQDGIDGWRAVLEYIDDVRNNATEGVPLLSASPDAEANGYAGLSRISWGGGGAVYSYSTETTSTETHSFTRTIGIESTVGAGFSVELTASGATVGVQSDFELELEFETGRSESDERTSTLEVGFTLTDDDAGDAFVTEVLLDPVYGTPLFKTLSGRSYCPHEPGTVAREAYRLRINGGDHVSYTDVPPESRQVAELEICNASPTDDDLDFEVLAPPTENPGSLILQTSGVVLSRALEYRLESSGCVTNELAIDRGYTHFNFEGVVVRLQSLCDEDIYEEVTIDVDYIVPCANIEFSGYLEEEQYFYMSTDQRHALPGVHDGEMLVVLRNPLPDGLPWDTHPRLQQVVLQYRTASSGRGAAGPWLPATADWRDSSDAEIPEGTTDPYGYARLWWDVSGLPDGNYEMRAVTECEATTASTSDFDEVSTAILAGHFDRAPPELLPGFSEPADGVYDVGDEMSATFDERILCGGYTLTMRVPETDDDIDARLLDTICAGDRIRLRFGLALDLNRVLGRAVDVVISGLEDTSLNPAPTDFTWSFRVGNLDAGGAELAVDGLIIELSDGSPNPCAGGFDSVSCEQFRRELEGEIAAIMGVMSTRITVSGVEEQATTSTTTTTTTTTDSTNNGTRRWLQDAGAEVVATAFVIAPPEGDGDAPAWELGTEFYERLEDGAGMAPETLLSGALVDDANVITGELRVPTDPGAAAGTDSADVVDLQTAAASGAFAALFGLIAVGIAALVIHNRSGPPEGRKRSTSGNSGNRTTGTLFGPAGADAEKAGLELRNPSGSAGGIEFL